MQVKTIASLKDTSLFEVSFWDNLKIDFSSSSLRTKVRTKITLIVYFLEITW